MRLGENAGWARQRGLGGLVEAGACGWGGMKSARLGRGVLGRMPFGQLGRVRCAKNRGVEEKK